MPSPPALALSFRLTYAPPKTQGEMNATNPLAAPRGH